jgi:hypothetical protein
MTFGAAIASTTLGALNVASSATVNGLVLVQTNSTNANSISIGSGQTLTLAGGLTLGYDAGGGTGATSSNLTVTGGGVLAATGGAINISVNQAATNAAYYSTGILNLSGLANFTANVSTFNIGVGSTTTGVGTVILSNVANTITTPTLQVGNSGGNNGGNPALLSVLTLGNGTNVINAGSINVGFSKVGGTISWASPTPGTGTLTIGSNSGTGGANITIASNNGTATGAVDVGTLDLRGHNSTVVANTLSLGVGSNALTGGATGTLDFDTGTFTANTVVVGSKSGTGASGTTDVGAGIINLSGGSFTVNSGGSFTMATNTAATGFATAALNITGGTFTSNADITEGGGANTTASITLNGGTLDLMNHNIGGATTDTTATIAFQTGILQNVKAINWGGVTGVSKSTTGTLTLAGTNTYTGATQVTAGTVVVSGSISGTSSVAAGGAAATLLVVTGSVTTPGAFTVGNAATLSGNGIITAASLTASSTSSTNPAIVEPSLGGTGAGLTINTTGSGSPTVALSTNSTLQLSLANTQGTNQPLSSDYSKLTLGAGVSASIAGSTIAVTTAPSVNAGDLFTIIINNGASAISGMFANAMTAVNGSPGIYAFTSNGQSYEINYTFSGPTTGSAGSGFTQANFAADTHGTNVALLMVPEPNSWAMLLGSLGVALGLQRFRRRRA